MFLLFHSWAFLLLRLLLSLFCEIHLGLLSALELSRFGLGACWDPMVMNWGCYLKDGLLRPSPCTQSPGREIVLPCHLLLNLSAFPGVSDRALLQATVAVVAG